MTKEQARKRRAAIGLIRKALDEGRLGAWDEGRGRCSYREGEKVCAVGALLTDEEAGAAGPYSVADRRFPEEVRDRLERDTGFSMSDLNVLQGDHDEDAIYGGGSFEMLERSLERHEQEIATVLGSD